MADGWGVSFHRVGGRAEGEEKQVGRPLVTVTECNVPCARRSPSDDEPDGPRLQVDELQPPASVAI